VTATASRASVTLLVEEPFGEFGGMNPTGHAALYLSRVCAATTTSLRRCDEGEQGVVFSRYHRVSGDDWLAIPVVPYLYAVDRPDEVPSNVTPEDFAALRDSWRRKNLPGIAPGDDWIQLIGATYDRTIYAFGIGLRVIRTWSAPTGKIKANGAGGPAPPVT
jgi:hypothetical protein